MYCSPAPLLDQLGVDAGGFGQGGLDVADVGDLAAQMEVDQLEAVVHARGLHFGHGVEDFGDESPNFER